MDGKERKDIRPGLRVDIILKRDQRTGRLTCEYHKHRFNLRICISTL